MRKRLIVSVFIAFLWCAPAFAGHTLPGGGWCECGAPGCICYPGEDPSGQSLAAVPDKPTKKQPTDLGSQTLLILGVLLLMLRYKA